MKKKKRAQIILAGRVHRFPRKTFAFAICFTICILFLIGGFSRKSYLALKDIKNRHLKIQDLHSRIIYLDEVLTMSARMAVATGDAYWQQRYFAFEPALDTALQEIKGLSSHIYRGKFAEKTDSANARLVAMERRSFDLLNKGQNKEARQVLFSDEYEEQKILYAEGMNRLGMFLEEELNRKLHRQTNNSRVIIAALILIFILLIQLWVSIIRTISRWERALATKLAKQKELA